MEEDEWYLKDQNAQFENVLILHYILRDRGKELEKWEGQCCCRVTFAQFLSLSSESSQFQIICIYECIC